MSFEEAEALRERAQAFLRNAERLMAEEVWDLAAFSIEQYCQLLLKHKLLLKTGTYPRTHSLIRLIRHLGTGAQKLGALLQDENSLVLLTKIEDAYIAARYLPRQHEPLEVRSMLRFAKEVFGPIVEQF
jgi:HEPN domain-containing protein